MNANKFACISASISLLLLTSIPLANSASSGVINFRGAIVDGGCTINNSQRVVDIGCYKDGKVINTTAPITASNIKFPSGKVSGIKWLNDKHTLGIMNVTYM
ncbi:hypothetical protein IV04_20105 [Serratia sp. Ag1]|nr:hypothetical protein JV45_11330 [Serratia sp. Ag2]KFK95732.1 hypothetical protein IV04_20105 [Serratia sp. Ag1]